MLTTICVIRDPARGSYHFLRFAPLTRRWEPDLLVAAQARIARTRLYHLVNPPSGNMPQHYAEYQYATVDNDGTLTLMNEIRNPSVAHDFSDIRIAGSGLHRDYVRDTSDPLTDDAIFRNHRADTLGYVTHLDADEEDAVTSLQRIARPQLLYPPQLQPPQLQPPQLQPPQLQPPPLIIPTTRWWEDTVVNSPNRPSQLISLSTLVTLLRRAGDDARMEAITGTGVTAAADAVETLGDVSSALNTWYEENHQVQLAPPRRNIADAIIRDAISQKSICPISMELITQETAACVAPCYHIFQRDYISQWMEIDRTCPTCREPCRL